MEIKISQFCSMMFLIMSASLMGILDASLLNISGVDCYFVPILGSIIGLPILLLFIYIFSYKDNLTINQLLVLLFGKTIGKIISFIIVLFCISYSIITFNNLTSFVTSQYLYNTPKYFIDILFILISLYYFSRKERTIYRSSLMLFFITILLFTIGSTSLSFKININNYMPIFENGLINVIKCLYNYISYTTIPLFLLLITSKNKIDNTKINKKIIITYFITHFTIFITFFTLIGIFGIDLASLYQYPLYHLLKRVFIGGFIERLENALSIGWIIILFIPCAFSNYYLTTSIKDIFNINKKYIYLIVIIIMFLSQFTFNSNTYSEYFFTNIYPLFMTIILFIFLIIYLKIKKRHE